MGDRPKGDRGAGGGDVAAEAPTQGETARRGVYSVALLVLHDRGRTLEAQAFIAHSDDEAREMGLAWARQRHPGAWRYFAQTRELCGTGVIAALVAEVRRGSSDAIEALTREVEEVRRRVSGEAGPESIFSPQESDKEQ
jgi:hypothetical protein